MVSCPTTMFGLSMEKEELCWRMMMKKRMPFMTLGTLGTIAVPSLKILRTMGEPEEYDEAQVVEDDLGI
jgi:hypothetical protein